MPLSKLNEAQLRAATADLGHNLVIASAGTGKTSTIVARIAHLLNSGIDPSKILLLTFTNKAASEMIERLERYFSPQITKRLSAGTFHSVSNAILKQNGITLILKQPSELKTLLKSISERRDFKRISEISAYSGAYLYDIYSLFCNKCVKGEEFGDWFSANYPDHAELSDAYSDILEEFERQKARFNYADFNDLLLKMRSLLLSGDGDGVIFDEILVDEYQDTNSLQGSLIDAFRAKSLFCVGDFDQSIYAFNGANIDIIASFTERYLNAKVHSLNINYRSSPSILSLANKVIANNPRLYPKELKVSREGEFKPPKLLIYDELFSQYDGIAKIISQSHFAHSEIAIIFRNNSSADGLEMALKQSGISCKRKGGVSFFEAREIKAIIDLLGIFINPKDIMGFINIMEFARGIGNAAAKELFDALLILGGGNIKTGLINPDLNAKIFQRARSNHQLGLFDDFSEFRSSARFDNLNLPAKIMQNPILNYSNLTDSGARMLADLANLLSELNSVATAKSAIKTIMGSNIFKYIAKHLATKRATLKNGNVDLELEKTALQKIFNKAEVLAQMSARHSDIWQFYNFLTLGKNEIEDGDGVNLLTVHASKGLEFSLVFVVDLADGRFPNSKLMAMGGDIEEERRLFYVAVTRAKDELILSYAKYDKIRKTQYRPSLFLVEAGMANPI